MSTIKKIADCSTNMRMLDVVGTNVNGNKALGVLGQSTHVKNTLQVKYMLGFVPLTTSL